MDGGPLYLRYRLLVSAARAVQVLFLRAEVAGLTEHLDDRGVPGRALQCHERLLTRSEAE